MLTYCNQLPGCIECRVGWTSTLPFGTLIIRLQADKNLVFLYHCDTVSVRDIDIYIMLISNESCTLMVQLKAITIPIFQLAEILTL
jgi:hypothetical protein